MNVLYIGNWAKEGDPRQTCPNAEYIRDSFLANGHSITLVHEAQTSTKWVLENMKYFDLILTEEARLKNDYIAREENGHTVVYIIGDWRNIYQKAQELKIPVVTWLNNLY